MASSPSTQISIRIDKTSPYKGGTKTWSNRYHFDSTVAMTEAVFDALADWLVGIEKYILATEVTIIGAVGYDPGSDVPVWSKSYSQAGLEVPGSSERVGPLEQALLVRFTTTQRSVKNHPIYGFKYYHGAIVADGTDRELVPSGRKTSWDSQIAGMVSGTTVGGTLYKVSGPRGAVYQSGACETYYTHRDFPT
jgi:hypothetical protein